MGSMGEGVVGGVVWYVPVIHVREGAAGRVAEVKTPRPAPGIVVGLMPQCVLEARCCAWARWLLVVGVSWEVW